MTVQKYKKDYKRIFWKIVYQQIGQPRNINKFLEADNLPKLNQEEIENLNRLITNNEIESVIKKLAKIKVQDQTASQWILPNI